MKTLNLEIEITSISHLKDKSCYNHNFYEIKENHPWWSLQGNNNIIEEVCQEDYDTYMFALGHFDEKGDFVSVIEWESDTGCNGIRDYIKE